MVRKSDIEKRIAKILNEEETFTLSLILLAQMHKDKKYEKLSDLMFLFGTYKEFKQFIKYFEGQTLDIPSNQELRQCLKLLLLFQKTYIDKKDLRLSYDKLNIAELGLSFEYCEEELKKFKSYLVKEKNVLEKRKKKN